MNSCQHLTKTYSKFLFVRTLDSRCKDGAVRDYWPDSDQRRCKVEQYLGGARHMRGAFYARVFGRRERAQRRGADSALKPVPDRQSRDNNGALAEFYPCTVISWRLVPAALCLGDPTSLTVGQLCTTD